LVANLHSSLDTGCASFGLKRPIDTSAVNVK
jgi:hypothetical protein